jgi:tetratricopeptide (TPR) repeat protein
MSDLWRWVVQLERDLRKRENGRLADIIDKLPSAVCEDEHARADALANEGIALARGLEHPWLEVFLRHWHLQSRVLHRMEGESALGACVDLVDFAHGEETSKCPQSVCVVQDLSVCYAYVDGPGFVEERLAVSDETLARIDATWPCFSCISSEKAGAMRTKLGAQASLTFLEQQIAAMSLAGRKRPAHDVAREYLESLIELGRLDEALAFLKEGERDGRSDAHNTMERRIDRARVLGRMKRFDEARSALPKLDEIAATPLFYIAYADALELLCRGGAIDNDWRVGKTLAKFAQKLEQQGVLRYGLEMAEQQGKLALDRGAPNIARRALATMRRFAARLKRPLDALDRVGKLERAIEALEASATLELPTTDDDVMQALESIDDPERGERLLAAACGRSPANAALARMHARALNAIGYDDEAADVYQRLYAANAGDGDLALEVGNVLRHGSDRTRFEAFVATLERDAKEEAERAIAWWLRAIDRHEAGDVEAAIPLLDRVIAARPGAMNARLVRARCAREKADWATMLARLDEAIDLGAEAGLADWDRMIAATMLGAWDKVRASAARVGMELEGEGEIDDARGPCRVRFELDGEHEDLFALRTGPVTARVVQMSVPPSKQRYGEVVVFEPKPLNPPPVTEEEKKRPMWTYPVIAQLRPSAQRVFFVDGVHPGEERFDALASDLTAHGAVIRTLSGDGYRIAEAPGIYAGLAAPKDADFKAISALVAKHVEGCQLTWMELAEAAGDDDLAAAHHALAIELGL